MKRNKNLPFKLGDICFLPEQISYEEVKNSTLQFLKDNKEIVKKEFGQINIDNPFWFLQKLKMRYSINSFNFFKKLPKTIQRYIATENAIINEDAYSISPIMSYTSYGYILLDNGIIVETINALELHRLSNVKQLGFLMNPMLRDFKLNSPALGFDHTRGLHSMDVAVLLRLIGNNNPEESLNHDLLSIGGISHDGLTPAGSDTTKLIDLDLFDEDIHYEDLFKKPGWKFLKEKYSIDEKALKEMILNHGIHGQLLDIADKIAYTSRDVWEFVGLWKDTEEFGNKKYEQIKSLIKEHPDFCDIWKSVKIHNEQMVIEDGFKLGIFLTIRALMFAELYYNPASRFLEYMLAKRIINLLFKEKTLTKELLLECGDHYLEEKIWEFLGSKYFPISFQKSSYQSFKNEGDRQNYTNKFKNDYSLVLIPDDFKCVTKTGVNKYSVIKDGKIMIFKEAYPEMASEIEKIMTFEKNFGLYVISLEDLGVPSERYGYIKEKLENV